jgi:hypothetical protein
VTAAFTVTAGRELRHTNVKTDKGRSPSSAPASNFARPGRFCFGHQNVAARKASDKEVIMWKGLLKLASGIVVLGASVFAAVAATGVAGDGLVETFGGPEGDKGTEGTVSRKVS